MIKFDEINSLIEKRIRELSLTYRCFTFFYNIENNNLKTLLYIYKLKRLDKKSTNHNLIR